MPSLKFEGFSHAADQVQLEEYFRKVAGVFFIFFFLFIFSLYSFSLNFPFFFEFVCNFVVGCCISSVLEVGADDGIVSVS